MFEKISMAADYVKWKSSISYIRKKETSPQNSNLRVMILLAEEVLLSNVEFTEYLESLEHVPFRLLHAHALKKL